MRALIVFVFVFVLPVEVWAAWAHVQSAGTAGTSSQASRGLAFGVDVGSGRFIAIGGAVYGDAGAPASVAGSDDRGSTYTCSTNALDANVSIFLCRGVTTSSGANTVVITPSGSGFISFGMAELSGQDATPLDVDAGTDTADETTRDPEINITTGVANALIIAVATNNQGSSTNTWTPDVNYIEVAESENAGSTQTFSMVYRIATTATTYNVGWASLADAPQIWMAKAMSFKPSLGAPAGVAKRRIVSGD